MLEEVRLWFLVYDLIDPTAFKILNAIEERLWFSYEIVLRPFDSIHLDFVACFLYVDVFQQHTLKVYLLLLLVLIEALVVAQEIVHLPPIFIIPEVFGLFDLLGGVLEVWVEHTLESFVDEFQLYFGFLVELVEARVALIEIVLAFFKEHDTVRKLIKDCILLLDHSENLLMQKKAALFIFEIIVEKQWKHEVHEKECSYIPFKDIHSIILVVLPQEVDNEDAVQIVI